MSSKDWLEKDFYAVLGVGKAAPSDEIKKAYRKLARESHPDHNPGDAQAEERFKAASEAYDVLSDERKRKEYDEIRSLFGSGAFRRNARSGGAGRATLRHVGPVRCGGAIRGRAVRWVRRARLLRSVQLDLHRR